MGQELANLARTLTASPASAVATYLLREIPGFTPILQTVHLLSVSAVMGSIVLIDLRVLGLVLPSQPTPDLVRRLMPWTWCALPFLAVTGLVQVFGRPIRYLVNPVFGLKFAMLAPAIVLAAVFHRVSTTDPTFWQRSRGRQIAAKAIAACSLLLWIGVATAGRWIAYADYLFPPE